MEKIIVKNSSIKIEGYEAHSHPELEKAFMVYEPISHSYKYVAMHYDNDNKILYLPRGIDIWWLEKMIGTQAYVERNGYNKFDYYDDEIKMKTKYIPRDEDQIEALQFAVGKDKYKATETKSQLSINLNTGKGKTYVAIGAISIFGIKSAIITYSREVLLQWKKCFLEYTNLESKEVCEINGTPSILRLLTKTPEQIKQIKVFLITHGTLQSYGETKGWDSVDELFKYLKIGLKFYDEAHTNFTNLCMIDYYSNVFKTFYLTATPARSNSSENYIYQNSFKNVVSIDLFHPDTDPHTHYIAMRYNSRPSAQVISMCRNKYGLDRNKYTNYITSNINFQKMVLLVFNFIFTKIFAEPKDQMIVYIGTNDSILSVQKILLNYYPWLKNDIGIFSSIVNSDGKAEALKKKIILTTTKSAGAAIDIKNLKCTLLLAEPFKSEVLARQTLGRTRNNNTYYIEVVDRGFMYCNRYFLSKKKIFEKYALDTKFVEINDLELNTTYNKIMESSPIMRYGIIPYSSVRKPVSFGIEA